jgi:hypothetical protein
MLPKESNKRADEQAQRGTCNSTARGVRDNPDDSLVRAVRPRAVGERHDGKPEHSSEGNADRQPYEAHCPQPAAIH